MKLTQFLLAALVAASLAACGGDGNDAPPAIPAGSADKYVGTWSNCAPVAGATNGVVSARTDFVFAKTAPTALSLSLDGTGFSVAGCSGTVISTIKGLATGSATILGTKALTSGETVDLINLSVTSTIPELNGDAQEIAFVSGSTLKLGAATAPDAQGYPTALDNVTVFTKR